MENVVDGSVKVDDKVVEERMGNEREERIVVGSDQERDADDEVFEEAVGAEENLQEQMTESGLGNGSIDADATDTNKSVESGSEKVQENSNLEAVAESYTGVSSDVESQEDAVQSEVAPQGDAVQSMVELQEDVAVSMAEQKVEELSNEESFGVSVVTDNIDEGGTGIEDGTDELNGRNEAPKSSATSEPEASRNEDEGNMMFETTIEKPVNGANKVTDNTDEVGTAMEAGTDELKGGKEAPQTCGTGKAEALRDEDEGNVMPDTKIEKTVNAADKVDEGGVEMGAGTDDLNGGKEAPEAGTDDLNGGKEAPETSGTSKAEALRDEDEGNVMSDTTIEKSVNGADKVTDKIDEGGTEIGAGTGEFNGGKEALETSGTSKSKAVRDEDEGNVMSDTTIEKSVNGADNLTDKIDEGGTEIGAGTGELNGGKAALETSGTSKSKALRDEDEGNVMSDTTIEKSLNGADKVNNKIDELGTETEAGTDDLNGGIDDLKDTLSELNGGIDELKHTFSELNTNVKGAVAPENGTSSSSEKFQDGRDDKIEANKTNLNTEDHDDSQPEHSNETVNRVPDIFPATEDSEKKEKYQQDTQSTRVALGHEVQGAPGSSSSVEAHDESRKKVDRGQELKQNPPVIGKRENLPAPASSSLAKSTNSTAPPSRPAGLGRAAPLLEPAPRVVQQPRANGSVSQAQAQQIEDPANGEAEESDETREKLQLIRVKFLRLAHRLGQTPHNVVVAQVLYRLGLAEQIRGRNGGRVGGFSFDRASAMAEQLEAAGNEPLDFSCTIMVLGKTGVGKSATINSIFDEVKFDTDAFQTGTKKVQDVVGTVHGIKVRVIDTPGLLPSWSDQRENEKILQSVKRFIKKTPPDIVLYLDRLDMQSRDFGDMPLLRTITDIFGPSIWFNAIVVLTHAASAPPDGPNGTASSYDMFVTQRSHVVQQAIRQAAGDPRLMNPVSLVENHSACRTNRAGQRVLPNGQVWKPHLLLLSFASKILAEANTLLKLQDTPPGKPFATRSKTPPLPFLLSSLLQSRPQVKLPEEQYGDDDGLDDDLEESSDSEDESEYEELPPFKRLTKAQIAKLTKAQKKAYYDELEYREKLFMRKQLKEEKRRRKMMKKMAAAAKDLPSEYSENAEEESSGAASVPVPMPDLALPASFDSDNPTHRYRYLDSSNPWLVRPVLDTHGWDHDVGYEGINIERLFVAKDKIPISFSGQITKDKKDANVQMEVASSLKHGEGKATSLGFDMQTVGKDLAYTLRGETRFSNFRKNKATAGISVTQLGDTLSTGVKVEDKLIANKRFQVVMTGGAMTGRGDVAYGGSLEAQLRDKDYPLGRSLSTLGLSIMDWHGDLAIGCNVQSQVPVGRSTNLVARANLNNRGAGQVSIRINSSEQLQIALMALFPLLKKLLDYPQQMQFGQ